MSLLEKALLEREKSSSSKQQEHEGLLKKAIDTKSQENIEVKKKCELAVRERTVR